MELRQLKYFLKTQELLSFTEAAQSLHISQSTLSQQIKQLEIELDILLFNRIGRHISLTEAGALFVDFARQSVRKAEEGKQLIADMKQLKVGTITVGVANGLRDFFVAQLIAFALEFPEIKLKVIYEPSHILFEKLQQSKVDFIVAFHESEMLSYFNYKKLFITPMVLVAAEQSDLAAKKSITLEEICALPLVISTQGYDKNHTVYKAFEAKKLQPQFAIEVNDIPTTLALVSTGAWYSILVQTSIPDSTLTAVQINDVSLTRYAKLIALNEVYETAAVRALKERLLAAAKCLE